MNTTLIYVILGVILFLCIYALYNLIGSCEFKHDEIEDEQPDLTDEQRYQLNELNMKVQELESKLSAEKNFYHANKSVMENSLEMKQERIVLLQNNNDQLTREKASLEGKVRTLKLHIEALGKSKDKPVANLDFSIKKGAKVKGRLLPHGKNYITGIFHSTTRRGNLKLESGQIIDPVDAIEVF
jgi:cell division protein FtsB